MSQNVPSSRPPATPVQKRNRKVALICAAGFVAMIGASYAAVPIYRAFCQITGFDGTTRRADVAPDKVLERSLTIRFDANVRDLPWTFTAEQTSQPARIGETKIALFKVTNNSDHAITGRAIYNVVPEQAGIHFQKLDCFCFEDQTIQAGQTVDMPVLYFVDPKYAEDFNTRGKEEITLSYTFFPSVNAEPVKTEAKAPATKPVSALGGSTAARL